MEMGLRLGKDGEFPSYEESTTEGKPAIPDPRLKSTGSADPTYWVKCNRKGAEDLEKSPRRSQAEGGNQLGDTVGTDYIVGEGPMGWNAIFSASD